MTNTVNRGYPLPLVSRRIVDDLLNIQNAFTAIDGDVGTLFASMSGKVDTATLASYLQVSQRNAPNGVAGLNANSQIDVAQLPPGIVGGMKFQDAWNAATNIPAIPAASVANKNFYWIVSNSGNTNIGGITDWASGDWVVSTGTGFAKIDNTDGGVGINAANTFSQGQTAPFWRVDAYGYLNLSGNNVFLQCDNTDYFQYDRTGNAFYFVVSGAVKGYFNTTGVGGNGSQLTALNASNIASGIIPDARLPSRLGPQGNFITDWNAALENGDYVSADGANAPTASGWFAGRSQIVHGNPLYMVQRVSNIAIGLITSASTTTETYQRHRDNGTWGPWYRILQNNGELSLFYEPKRTRFLSGQYTYADGGVVTIPHPLGAEPNQYDVYCYCAIAEYGFSVGHKFKISMPFTSNAGATPIVDAANFYIRIGTAGIYVIRFDTGVHAKLTPANWRIIAQGNL